MCTQGGGGGYPSTEAPWFEDCEPVINKAVSLAQDDGHEWEQLTDEDQDKYLRDASEIVHADDGGDRYDNDPDV